MMVDALQGLLQGLFGSLFPLVWTVLKIVLIIAPHPGMLVFEVRAGACQKNRPIPRSPARGAVRVEFTCKSLKTLDSVFECDGPIRLSRPSHALFR